MKEKTLFTVDRVTEADTPINAKEALMSMTANDSATKKTVPLFSLKGLGKQIQKKQQASVHALECFGTEMKGQMAQIPQVMRSEQVQRFGQVAMPVITTAMMARGLTPANANTVKVISAQRAKIAPMAIAGTRAVASRVVPRAMNVAPRALALA